jgi:hypothetical protein
MVVVVAAVVAVVAVAVAVAKVRVSRHRTVNHLRNPKVSRPLRGNHHPHPRGSRRRPKGNRPRDSSKRSSHPPHKASSLLRPNRRHGTGNRRLRKLSRSPRMPTPTRSKANHLPPRRRTRPKRRHARDR